MFCSIKQLLVLLLMTATMSVSVAEQIPDNSKSQQSTGEVKKLDRDFHLSVAGYYVNPDEVALNSSQALGVQLGGSIKMLQVGFEYFSVINSPHNYRYAVPYGSIEEHREFDIHSGQIYVKFIPLHLFYATPYVGAFFGGNWFFDRSNNTSVFDEDVTRGKYIAGGPIAGIELLPNSIISIFVEARKNIHLKGAMPRKTVKSVDQFGKVVTKTQNIKFNALYAGAGIRFNF